VWRNIRIIYGNDTESEDEDEDIAGDEEVAFLEEE
jgi:hypothetical protein